MPARPAPAPAMKPRRDGKDTLGPWIDRGFISFSSRYHRHFAGLLSALYQIIAGRGIIAEKREMEAAHGCPHDTALHRHPQGLEDAEPGPDPARRAPDRHRRRRQLRGAEAQGYGRGGRLGLDPGAARRRLAARRPTHLEDR